MTPFTPIIMPTPETEPATPLRDAADAPVVPFAELHDDSVPIHAASLIAAEDKRKEAQRQAWKKYEQVVNERDRMLPKAHWEGVVKKSIDESADQRSKSERAIDSQLADLFARRRNWRYRLVKFVRNLLHL